MNPSPGSEKARHAVRYLRKLARRQLSQPLLFALLLLLLLASHPSLLTAQGWQEKPTFNNYDFAKGGHPTPDGGYLIAGETGPNDDLHNGYLLKLDPFGNEQWRRLYGGPGFDAFDDIEPTADGGYVMLGATFSFATGGGSDAWLVKVDRFGEVQWQQVYGGAAFEFGRKVIQTSDGGFALTGRSDNGSDVGILVIKTDSEGNQEWLNIYGGAEEDEGWGITENTDNQLVILGSTSSFGAGERDMYVATISLLGNFDSFQLFGGTDDDLGTDLIATSDGGLLIGGATRSFGAGDYDVILIKTNADATVVDWQQTYGGAFGEWGAYLQELPSGGFAFAGSAQSFNNLLDDLYLVRTEADGTLLWQRTFGNERKDIPHSLTLLPDGGYLIAAHSRVDTSGSIETSESYLLRADPNGQALNNFLQGKIFDDTDGGCDFDAGETGFENWILTARKTDGTTFFGNTDMDGNFSILTDTGSYTLTLTPPNQYWTPCENALSLTFASLGDTLSAHFPLQKTFDCAQLEIDLATAITRPCESSTWQVRYCNHGTAIAEGAFVEITLDSFLTFEGSGIPPSGQNGLTYRFDLGNLAPGVCGAFPLTASLDCAVEMGRTHCLDAHIFPDSTCLPPGPTWDGASIEVSSACEGDTVVFKIKNKGTGGMAGTLRSIIVEDQIMTRALEFQLPAGDSILVHHPAFGKTLRMEAEQSPGHPGRSAPSITVEGCNQSAPNISKGFHTMLPEDDADPFRSLDCRESTQELPINDKLAFPKGLGAQHLIRPGKDIEYLVPFQNTGPDSVAHVVIRDTLSPLLDLTTLRPGAASHPYQLEVSNTGVLQFTLTETALPNSTTDEAASRGFVKFRVSQLPDLQHDSLIENRSCVFFDFGQPAAKPQTFHTLDKPQVFSISDVSLCTGGLYQGVAIESDTSFLAFNELPLVDSFSFANITALPVYDLLFSDSICANEAYPWLGGLLSAPGIFDSTLVSSLGCDSSLTLDLAAIPLPTSSADTAVAIGSFFLDNQIFTDTIVLDTVFNEIGCDTLRAWSVSAFTGTADWGAGSGKWRVFPNPASGEFTLSWKALAEPLEEIAVFNSLGQKVLFFGNDELPATAEHSLHISTQGWAAGVFLIFGKTKNGYLSGRVMVR